MTMQLFKNTVGTIACTFLLSPAVSLGHGNEMHQAKMMQEQQGVQNLESGSAEKAEHKIYSEINRKYIAKIKPILIKSCANCHSSETKYPWYYNVPGIRQLIDSDISEAKNHLDLTFDFPFVGHGLPATDLEAIRETVSKRKMPPWSYRLMHPESELPPEAERKIVKWVQESLVLLRKVSDRKSSNDEN